MVHCGDRSPSQRGRQKLKDQLGDAHNSAEGPQICGVRNLSSSFSAPRFPRIRMEAYFKGESVNLDVVFSSLHHIAPPKENVGRIGGMEISLGKSDLARKVQMSSDWNIAWHTYTKVIVFVFPHWGEELRQWATTWLPNSLPSTPTAITSSLHSTRQSGLWLEEVSQSSSLTRNTSLSSIQPTFSPMESKEVWVDASEVGINEEQENNRQTFADNSTVLEGAITH